MKCVFYEIDFYLGSKYQYLN